MLRSMTIGYAGDNLPTNNFPGIGGTTGAGDSPTMIFNSGGTTIFNVVSRERGLWTDSVSAYNELIVVGDDYEDIKLKNNNDLVFVKTTQRSFAGEARNFGAGISKGKYLLFLNNG